MPSCITTPRAPSSPWSEPVPGNGTRWRRRTRAGSDKGGRMFASRHHDHEPLTATHAVQIACGTAIIHADLTIPAGARGIVIFAHGSGSSRTSRRNQSVAAELNWGRLATL